MLSCSGAEQSAIVQPASEIAFARRIIMKNPFNDRGDAFDVAKAHFGLTGKLDQIAPDSFRMGKSLPYPCFEIRQQMNRHITSLHFVASAA